MPAMVPSCALSYVPPAPMPWADGRASWAAKSSASHGLRRGGRLLRARAGLRAAAVRGLGGGPLPGSRLLRRRARRGVDVDGEDAPVEGRGIAVARQGGGGREREQRDEQDLGLHVSSPPARGAREGPA